MSDAIPVPGLAAGEAGRLPPSVAVVIPCWNAEKWIARAIESVLGEGYPRLEIIVIDDGSTDGSLGIIRSFGARVRWESGANQGACAARNRGLRATEADFVVFLDADDYFEDGSISARVAAAAEVGADICFGPSVLEHPDGRRQPRPVPDPGLPHPITLSRILDRDWVPIHAILWRRQFVADLGGWKPGMLRNQDGELVCRALRTKPRLQVTPTGRAVYVQHASANRVSARLSKTVLESQLDHLTQLRNEIRHTEFACAQYSVGIGAYDLARACFSSGEHGLGRQALALARACGYRANMGSLMHRLSCAVLGLERKERAVGFARAFLAASRLRPRRHGLRTADRQRPPEPASPPLQPGPGMRS